MGELSADAAWRGEPRAALWPFRLALAAVLRLLVTCVVFVVCAAVALRLLGYELPGASELEQYMESIGRLADVLS